jgi:hypothetical protein
MLKALTRNRKEKKIGLDVEERSLIFVLVDLFFCLNGFGSQACLHSELIN